MQTRIHTLTNRELVTELQLRDDLTTVEHELVDRLIRAMAVIDDLEKTPAGRAIPARDTVVETPA